MDKTLNIAKNIRQNVLHKKELDTLEFQEFKSKYPKFYEMLLKPDMDNEMFNKLIHLLSANLSSTDQSAAIAFSTFGAEKYLYPQFGRPNEDEIKTATNKIKKMS